MCPLFPFRKFVKTRGGWNVAFVHQTTDNCGKKVRETKTNITASTFWRTKLIETTGVGDVKLFTVAELKNVSKHLRRNKCADSKGIVAECFAYGCRGLREHVLRLFNLLLGGHVKERWKQITFAMIPKSVDFTNPGNGRPLAILNITYKICPGMVTHVWNQSYLGNSTIQGPNWVSFFCWCGWVIRGLLKYFSMSMELSAARSSATHHHHHHHNEVRIAYSKPALNSNGLNTSPCFRPRLIGNCRPCTNPTWSRYNAARIFKYACGSSYTLRAFFCIKLDTVCKKKWHWSCKYGRQLGWGIDKCRFTYFQNQNFDNTRLERTNVPCCWWWYD